MLLGSGPEVLNMLNHLSKNAVVAQLKTLLLPSCDTLTKNYESIRGHLNTMWHSWVGERGVWYNVTK